MPPFARAALTCAILLLANGSAGAAPLGASEGRAAHRPEQIYGYADPEGTLHLTNVQWDRSELGRYRLLAETSPERPERVVRGAVALPESVQLRSWVEEAAAQNRLESALLYAVMLTESGYDASAVSPRGAVGIMQLMPKTGAQYGVTNLLDSRENLFAGARHLRILLDQFGEDLTLALAAYNSGVGSVRRFNNTVPPFLETQAYVPKVLGLYDRLRTATEAQRRAPR